MSRFIREVPIKKLWKKYPCRGLSTYKPNNYSHNVKVICSRQYSQQRNEETGGGIGRKILIYLGAALTAGAATLAYAKHDDDFRKTLVKIAPFTNGLIATVWQENSQSNSLLGAYYQNIKESVGGLIGNSDTKKESLPTPSAHKAAPTPLTPIFEKDVKKASQPIHNKKGPEKLENIKGDPPVSIVDESKSKPQSSESSPPSLSTEASQESLKILEDKLSISAEEAVNAFNKASYLTKQYNGDIEYIIDEAVNEIRPEVWEEIKKKTRSKEEIIRIAKEKADVAAKDIIKLKAFVSGRNLNISNDAKKAVQDNISRIQDNIETARKSFENEQKSGKMSEKYWDKVEKARKHFASELESLFPTIDLSKKELKINQDDIDLFVLHAYANILFYQKELAKMETIISDRMRSAVEAAKKGGGEPLTSAQISEALEQERRKLSLYFQQHVLKLNREHELELREALKRQSQTFTDHLEDAVKQREEEIQRVLTRKFDELLENERSKAKLQMSAIVGRLKGIDQALKDKQKTEEAAKQGQVLWSACQSLLRAIKAGCPGLAWKEQLRPLEPEIRAVEKAAAAKDELVSAVLKGIPQEARDRGVFPEDALRERFLKVEKVAKTMALVPAEGAALPVHVLSYLQSKLLINEASPIPQAELNDEKIDVSKLNTTDILQRARYWMDRGDLAQTLRYMNLLQGAARCIARDWMNETRIYLETQQAANTLMAYATSSGIAYL